MVFPNAFIVGVNKSGTTSIFNMLSRQENVCVSTTKETHFFDPLKYGDKLPPITDYENFFRPKPTDKVILEATPGYFYGGEPMARALREISPHGRAAIILREPGARAFSWWRFCRGRLWLPQDLSFETYLDQCEPLGLSPEVQRELSAWRGLSGGRYDEWIPAWKQVFGDDLLIMFLDTFVSDERRALTALGAHLGIAVTKFDGRRDNESVDIRNPRVQRLAFRANGVTERLWRRHPELKRTLLNGYYKLNSRTRQERMSPATRKRLNAYFEAPIQRLRAQVRDVPARWGTERVSDSSST